MRLPGTLKELSKQLAEFSSRVTRLEFPTEYGLLVLEFGEPRIEAKPQASTRTVEGKVRTPGAEASKPDGRLPEKPKVRDTALLTREAPRFDFEYGPEAKPS